LPSFTAFFERPLTALTPFTLPTTTAASTLASTAAFIFFVALFASTPLLLARFPLTSASLVLGALVALIHVAFGHALVSLVRARCLAGAAHAAQLLAAIGQLAYADIAVPVAVRDALQV